MLGNHAVKIALIVWASQAAISEAVPMLSAWVGGDGSWSDVLGWTTPHYPNNGNGAPAYDAVIGDGSVYVDIPVVIEGLTLSGGVVWGHDTLTLSSLTWTGGSFAGTGLVTVGGGVLGSNLYGTLLLEGTTLRMAGNADWFGDHISHNGTAGNIVVASGTTFTRADGTGYGFGPGQTYEVYANVLVESGATLRHNDTGLSVFHETFTNEGTLQIDQGTMLLGSGFTNFDAHTGTLTGGQYWVTSTLQFEGANITTNRAKLILMAPGAGITDLANADALQNLALNDTGARVELHYGRSLSTAAALTNRGGIELFGGSLDSAVSITTTSGSTLAGFGTILKRPSNAGRIQANGGTLNLAVGVQGAGILEASNGTLDVSGATGDSSTGELFLYANGGLILGNKTVSVDSDFHNQNAGFDNSYNPRAGVSGSGLINSSVAKTQTLTGDVSGGSTAMPMIDLGAVRIGVDGQQTATAAFRINNSAGGPFLRGAVKTSGNGANLVGDSQFALVGGPQNFGPIAAGGQSGEFTVSFTGAAAGAASRTLAIVNNFDNVDNQIVTVSAVAFTPASPSITPDSINLGDFHVGQPAQQAITIANNAPADAFSESLIAGVTTSGADVSRTGPASVTVAPGASSASVGVSVSTAAAGAKTGSVNIVQTSNGATGLPDLSLGTEVIPVSASVYRLADPVIQDAQPIDFGIVHIGDVVTPLGVSIRNAASADGFSEQLDASFNWASSGVVTSGAGLDYLAAGFTNSTGLRVGVDTSTARAISGAAQIAFTSDGTGVNTLGQTALTTQSVAVTATVNNFANAVLSKASGDGVLSEQTTDAYVLDLGGVRNGQGDLSAELELTNLITGPADDLAGGWTVGSSDFTVSGFGAFGDLAAGDSINGLTVTLDDAISGAFSHTITLSPRSTNASGFDGTLAAVTVQLVGTVFLPGDYNTDGSVTQADYDVWTASYGSTVNFDADGNNDGRVDGADYTVWRDNVGGSLPSIANSAAVPEPTTCVLLLSAFLAEAGRRRLR